MPLQHSQLSPNTLAHNTLLPGKHVLLDFWGAKFLKDKEVIEGALQTAADACGATVLSIQVHEFGESTGITGVAILAESHITIHTWPEIDYAALDIFVCGTCDPDKATKVLTNIFQPEKSKVTTHHRGQHV